MIFGGAPSAVDPIDVTTNAPLRMASVVMTRIQLSIRVRIWDMSFLSEWLSTSFNSVDHEPEKFSSRCRGNSESRCAAIRAVTNNAERRLEHSGFAVCMASLMNHPGQRSYPSEHSLLPKFDEIHSEKGFE